MDGYEATRIVFSRIQNLDPENASKIMGLLLIQDHGEKEMIRLAFGPETLVHSVILKARKELGLGSPTNTSSSPSSPSPLYSSNPIAISRQNNSSSTSRLGFNIPPSLTIPNPSSNNNSSWSDLPNPEDLMISPNGSSLNPASVPFYANGVRGGGESDLMDEFQLQDQLSFLNEGAALSVMFRGLRTQIQGLDGDHVSTSLEVTVRMEVTVGLFMAGLVNQMVQGVVGSPNSNKIDVMDQCHELLRSKSAHQQSKMIARGLLLPL
ncbi:hypothetical protein OIU77_026442 [Salix suchowensis]|uniref:AtC3H46-like PABC-like domain-containing protein n=1 Tax=Salix suchowensis TaxID=1278906 RepID=A0ABQ9BN02_9ROSI|nr:hypothetical protein OIU77_026442 [Salix suchowensis]